ncbi:hypothetical protein Ancab_010933 [Ancistrocladus abbreviatus]
MTNNDAGGNNIVEVKDEYSNFFSSLMINAMFTDGHLAYKEIAGKGLCLNEKEMEIIAISLEDRNSDGLDIYEVKAISTDEDDYL